MGTGEAERESSRERNVPAIGLVGPSGSGKTTLARQLVPLLRAAGLRVGYLKHAHHRFDLDRPGKDTHALRSAGAEQVLIASRHRWALQVEERDALEEPDFQALRRRLADGALDFVLVEGFKHAAYPKIAIHRAALGQPAPDFEDPDLIAVASDGEPPVSPALPILDLNDPPAVAAFILARLDSRPGARAVVDGDPRVALVRHYGLLRRYGYNDSHSGNASVRDGECFYVTPTGANADALTPAELIRCPLDGPLPPGASMDAPIHQRVYRLQPRARALLHSHPPHALAWTLHGDAFVPVDFEGQVYFPRVPVVEVALARYAEEAPDRIAQPLTGSTVVMARGHGLYAWGESLERAYQWTSSLEHSARIAWLARQLDRP